MSNICLDIRYLSEKPSGIGRYIKNLTESLISLNNKDTTYYLLGQRKNCELIDLKEGSFEFIEVPCSPEQHPQTEIWFNFFLPKIILKNNISVFHSTSFMAPLRKFPCALITSIHDRVAKKFGDTLPFLFRQLINLNVSFAMKNSDAIITISKQTQKDLMKEFRTSTPIHVVPLGAFNSLSQVRPDYSLVPKKPYIFYVGNMEPRKGIVNLLNGFHQYKKEHPGDDLGLVLCGQTLWGYDEPQKIVQDKGLIQDVEFLGYVSESSLKGLYEHSLLCVVPSLYEGFGLPVLEAMMSKKPVLINDIDVLKEVSGNLAHKVDFSDSQKVSKKLYSLRQLPYNEEELSMKYLSHISKYTWEQCALKTYEIYKEVISKPKF